MSSNLATIKKFIEARHEKRENNNLSPADDIIEIGGLELIPVICPSHGVKGTRNNFINKHLEFNASRGMEEEKPLEDRQFAKWEIIEKAWKIDTTSNTTKNVLNKLTDAHIVEDKMKKMRVKNAVQVLSKSVGDFIMYLTKIDGGVETRGGRTRERRKRYSRSPLFL
ncbi:uncharacterized protein LOC107037543 [Diachasma alloeum]|uniref:uncharacterized protein LOC107037543 n=1 Tax=Diachasma alloeum TaxID=454923 RepID=UPI00073839FD|nr:uncharacterized protein LOC107037543 [Diachasma alloeum]